MLTFEWPWLLVLLPLPILYRLWRRRAETLAPALKAPVYCALAAQTSVERRSGYWQWLTLTLLFVAWAGTLLAATRPTWIGDPVTLPSSGRDLLIAVDISGSMKQTDMRLEGESVDRLTVVKQVVGEFVERRQGDRLGLILFGTRPYLQTPLTFDRQTMNTLLNEAQIGFAGESTAIGDAIGLAVKRLQSRPENHRVLILLTDGANSAGEAQPLEAAEIAAREGITIYTIGIGAEVVVERSFFGSRRINPSRDLDETTLTAIADKTGGRYFRARNPDELQQIYAQLDQLEPVEQEAETLRPTKALFYWPLGVALLCSLLLAPLTARGDS
ncbi:vWA domain-containing protein [Porticoccus litoralis]|uniref:VWA domain-containing protein n=1 Tax=Porticoccus litoralis TaxID=434086 RepID=A0AAW8B6M4_9GAMM|nr:VWA domain-containing protein [Porticoccus litoralis]MDP1521229.1 VWA domain-containing protein [Porticoccus litoralis]